MVGEVAGKYVGLMLVPALIIFGKIHFLPISENEFFMKLNVTELQVCMEFMPCVWEIQQKSQDMNSMTTCPSVTFNFMKNSFSGISRKCI